MTLEVGSGGGVRRVVVSETLEDSTPDKHVSLLVGESSRMGYVLLSPGEARAVAAAMVNAAAEVEAARRVSDAV